jgi:hypothetical protein
MRSLMKSTDVSSSGILVQLVQLRANLGYQRVIGRGFFFETLSPVHHVGHVGLQRVHFVYQRCVTTALLLISFTPLSEDELYQDGID